MMEEIPEKGNNTLEKYKNSKNLLNFPEADLVLELFTMHFNHQFNVASCLFESTFLFSSLLSSSSLSTLIFISISIIENLCKLLVICGKMNDDKCFVPVFWVTFQINNIEFSEKIVTFLFSSFSFLDISFYRFLSNQVRVK